MTEYNIFCYADDKEEDGFQPPRYRIFNTQISEEEYRKINIPYIELSYNDKDNFYIRYTNARKKARAELTQEQKQKFYDLPHFNRDIFTKITGIEKEEDAVEMTLQEVCEKLGKNIKIIK